MAKRVEDPWTARRLNLFLGVLMTVAGVLLLVSMTVPMEIVPLASGAVLILAGLSMMILMFAKHLPASDTWLAAAALALGAVLFVHDLILPPPINAIALALAGLGVLVLGLAGWFGVSNLGKRMRRRSTPPGT